MKISRIVVKNYRAFQKLDVNVQNDLCCILGENNTGKTALFRAIQICLDISLPSSFRSLIREDINTGLNISEPSQVLIGIELSDFQGNVNEEALVSTWKTGPDDRSASCCISSPTDVLQQGLQLRGRNDLGLPTWHSAAPLVI